MKRISGIIALTGLFCAGGLLSFLVTQPTWAANRTFHIGLSNSYIGNQWRVQMVNLTKAYAQKYYSDKVRLTVVNSGTDVSNCNWRRWRRIG